ncbi:MAG: CHAT domain-containing protein [Verrucomicrobia bacterium]|nr:CHAT domain-containing protein [Verrucomicrobiota bacterium]
MKSSSLPSVVFAIWVLLFGPNTRAASTVTAFDGTWSVTINAQDYKNADGTVALAWVRYFPAKVKNGILHGEAGARGEANWYELDGKIEANGSAVLHTRGTTGKPAYTVAHVHPNTSYEYQVIAHFDNQHGTGNSVNDPPRRPRVRLFTFVRDTVNDVYRQVVDLLVSQGKSAESEQVLRLLKRKEIQDFLPGETEDAKLGGVPKTAYDQHWQERFNTIHDQLATIGRDYSTLAKKESRTDEENQRLAALESDLAVAQQALQQLYQDISVAANPKLVRDLQESGETLMQNLPSIEPGAVVIETIVLPDKYRVILTTPDVQIPAEYTISRDALRKKVFAFRDAINSRRPEAEIKALANELYQILFGPIAKNIESYQPKTLVWSLDDVLRYVPMAALYDGSHYLAERYANVVITLASLINLKDKPSSEWTALGLGVSKAHQNWPELRYVPVELKGIIRDQDAGGTTGILQGRIMLDEAFTEANLRDALIRKLYRVVHIASHFKFDADGNSNDSFLLLGNGKFTKLTIAQIAAIPNFFAGVELLTLSACETAVGDQASRQANNQGVEVEGLGVLAQRKGAAAVIASLWEVADVSTSKLMQNFYQGRASANATTKAEALRQAQLELLLQTNGEYSHPFYWAPFVIIGNWQ